MFAADELVFQMIRAASITQQTSLVSPKCFAFSDGARYYQFIAKTEAERMRQRDPKVKNKRRTRQITKERKDQEEEDYPTNGIYFE